MIQMTKRKNKYIKQDIVNGMFLSVQETKKHIVLTDQELIRDLMARLLSGRQYMAFVSECKKAKNDFHVVFKNKDHPNVGCILQVRIAVSTFSWRCILITKHSFDDGINEAVNIYESIEQIMAKLRIIQDVERIIKL